MTGMGQLCIQSVPAAPPHHLLAISGTLRSETEWRMRRERLRRLVPPTSARARTADEEGAVSLPVWPLNPFSSCPIVLFSRVTFCEVVEYSSTIAPRSPLKPGSCLSDFAHVNQFYTEKLIQTRHLIPQVSRFVTASQVLPLDGAVFMTLPTRLTPGTEGSPGNQSFWLLRYRKSTMTFSKLRVQVNEPLDDSVLQPSMFHFSNVF